MKFSIVTPNYNYGRFLKKALESVLAQVENVEQGGASRPGEPQTGRGRPSGGPPIEIEHIVIDGGSSDDSVQILENWDSFVRGTAAAKESRYSFQYVSEPDKGQTDAINKGLRRATGDVVAWLNADEYYLPGKLALVAAFLEKHPKADFVYGEPLFVKADGFPIRIRYAHGFSKFVLYGCCCYIASCASFWRRRVLDDGHYLDPSYKVIMDGEYYCCLAKMGYRFRFLPATIAAFAFHDSNAMNADRRGRNREWYSIRRAVMPLPAWLRPRERLVRRSLKRLGRQWHRILILFRLAFQKNDHGR